MLTQSEMLTIVQYQTREQTMVTSVYPERFVHDDSSAMRSFLQFLEPNLVPYSFPDQSNSAEAM
jgi:hypothetical protein